MSKRPGQCLDNEQQPSPKRQRLNPSSYSYVAPNAQTLRSEFEETVAGIEEVIPRQANLESLISEWNERMEYLGFNNNNNNNNRDNIPYLVSKLDSTDYLLMKRITSLTAETLQHCVSLRKQSSKCSDIMLDKLEQSRYEKKQQYEKEKMERDSMFGGYSMNSLSHPSFNKSNESNKSYKSVSFFPFPSSLKHNFCSSQNKLPPNLKPLTNLYHNGFVVEMSEPPINNQINIENKCENIHKSQSLQPPHIVNDNGLINKQSIFNRFKYQKQVNKWYNTKDTMFGCDGNKKKQFAHFLGFVDDENIKNETKIDMNINHIDNDNNNNIH